MSQGVLIPATGVLVGGIQRGTGHPGTSHGESSGGGVMSGDADRESPVRDPSGAAPAPTGDDLTIDTGVPAMNTDGVGATDDDADDSRDSGEGAVIEGISGIEGIGGFGPPPVVPQFDLLGSFAADDDEEPDWQERALCAQTDPEAFFPEKGGSTREAKRICSGCEVRAECLDYALAHDERFGIWGGLSERERRRLRRAAI